jgi:hypothetical protein
MEMYMTHPDLSLFILLIGMALGAQKSSRNHTNKTSPRLRICADVETAMHALKSALLQLQYDGSRWRLLQIDPAIGQMIACLDLMEAQREISNGELTIARTQLMLLCSFCRKDQYSEVTLSWRIGTLYITEAGHQAIANTIDSLMKTFPTENNRESMTSGFAQKFNY